MLRAIGVPSRNFEQDDLRRSRAIARRHQRRSQLFVALDDLGASPDFYPPTCRVIDQKQLRLVVFRQIANGDELLVADEINKTKSRLVEHAQNAILPWLVELFGGRQSARTIHFIAATLLVLFVIVHLVMVLLAGPINGVRAMITGKLAISTEDEK